MKKMNLNDLWPTIIDYTGGTKTMSAAMVWASSKSPCKFSYIGADSTNARDKGGLGIVLDGREKCLIQENPWDKMAYFAVNDAVKLFNRGQYANAAEMFADITQKVTDDRAKRVFTILHNIIEAYSQWDMFNHKRAQQLLGANLKPLTDIAETERFYIPNIKQMLTTVEDNFIFISSLKHQQLSWFMIHDLLANALRRAEIEKKYEDATARVYSAIEKIAKYQLKLKYGIDNSNCPQHRIPENLRQEYIQRYATDNDNLQFGIIASFRLLQAFNDIYAKRFFAREHITEHLTERNYSILGHGMQSIDKDKFAALFDDALAILNINKKELPQFPKL